MKHELKIWPQYYCRVANGSKTFEVRINDRGFQPGDTVVLHEFDPKLEFTERDEHPLGYDERTTIGNYTKSKPLEFKIGYVMPLENNKVVFSLVEPSPGYRMG